MRIYIAGPISLGYFGDNLKKAVQWADAVWALGHTPFLPHTTLMWDLCSHHSYEDWMDWDFEWIKVCDALVRIPGESKGADREVAFAKSSGIPVFYDLGQITKGA